ncbi:anaphase-promoting complex component apc8 [Spiromyces aspiralis]|uniref:Anaphase-promoting complex component apc8 n=1 Tax=Spiromyces aspiralis TaxID=68401 RepID=A0ACC1HPF4_9FUNG|nr:anaphase-promoting complex component apc8 [Spiromyces aspiralis]
MYFQRALRLDRSYLSAWTLMGHEYMELKNTSAAIQAYRRAVEVDERDYRAWYGLGQTYEMLKQPQYAFYYFKRAVALRPFDSRMWCALANCYEMSNELGNAIASYQRALSGSQESEHIAIVRLGKLYSQVGKPDTAAYYYKMFYDRAQSEELDPEEVSNAALFLASYYQERGRIDQVEKYLKEVIDLQSSRQEEAKAMLRAIASSSRASAMGTGNSVGARPANRMQMS